jgi:hypothetical protein
MRGGCTMLAALFTCSVLALLLAPVCEADKTKEISTKAPLEHFPADANLDEAIQRFQEWFEKGYGPGLGVKLARAGDGMRLGVYATRTFNPGETYLTVPLNMVISEDTMFATPTVGPILKKLKESVRAGDFLALGLFLLHQRYVAGESSFWRPYIDLLPVTHDSPAFFTNEQLKLVKGTNIEALTHEHNADVTRQFNEVRKNVLNQHAAVFPPSAVNATTWRWVAGILNSRMIWWDNSPHLVPMLDMINCRQGPPPYERRVHQTTRRGDKAVTHAPWRYAKGEQIFENYGQPNPTYFQYHGFVIHPNVHDCSRVPWHNVQPSEKPPHKHHRAPLPPANQRKAQELRLWRDDVCIAPTVGIDDYLALARVMTAAPNTLNRFTDVAVARREADRRSELRALRQAAMAIKIHLEEFPKIPKELSNHAAAIRGKSVTIGLSTGAKDEHAAGASGDSEAAAWNSALADGIRRWVASEEFQALPFRNRMALEFRESQRVLLLKTIDELRRRKQILQPTRPKDSRKTSSDEL